MLKLTREMVSKMGKEITGVEKGKTCSIATFNKVNKILHCIYETIAESNKIFNGTSPCVYTFGNKHGIKFIYKNGVVSITDIKLKFLKGEESMKWETVSSEQFKRLLTKKVKGLDAKEFLNKIALTLWNECKEKDDFDLYRTKEFVPLQSAVNTVTAKELKSEGVKVRVITIFGIYNIGLLRDMDKKINIPTDYFEYRKQNNSIITKEHSRAIYIYTGNDDIDSILNSTIRIDKSAIKDFKELYIIYISSLDLDIRNSMIENSDYVYNLVDHHDDIKFELIKQRSIDKCPFIKDEDIIKVEQKEEPKVEALPQIILNSYLTDKAIKMFTKKGIEIVDDYNIFIPGHIVDQYTCM